MKCSWIGSFSFCQKRIKEFHFFVQTIRLGFNHPNTCAAAVDNDLDRVGFWDHSQRTGSLGLPTASRNNQIIMREPGIGLVGQAMRYSPVNDVQRDPEQGVELNGALKVLLGNLPRIGGNQGMGMT